MSLFFSLSKFSYWSKFHVNIVAGSWVMTIFFCKGFTGNLEIGNTPVWVLPSIWRLDRVSDTRFGMNVFDKVLQNAAKCQGYSFYYFWVIKGKPTEGVKLLPPPRLIESGLTTKLLRCFIPEDDTNETGNDNRKRKWMCHRIQRWWVRYRGRNGRNIGRFTTIIEVLGRKFRRFDI